ncbi:hypothetical protein PV735_38820 [Streptomyces turgidiscabies]|uniref:hypothetical protein n=1 Tax=Streptomyces TaxID=1883 RepID=UPI00076E5752|nr:MULTISPECIES: hypothetical protein [Streptomyces]MDX3498603.1 hypothetical protein [Streptomyces turgidiscabies]GAQ73600.1 hypothetical protein T45_05360 [Streptomyces turgidiscabies]
MPNMQKTFADYEVLTADDVNDYLMNQVIVKVDTSTDLASLPTEVKAAYVVDTGLTMARDNTDVWVPLGGVATVSPTAPSNPQTGQLWVMPSQSLPAPVHGSVSGASAAITGVNNTYVNHGSTVAFNNTTGRALKVAVSYGSTVTMPSTSSDIRIRCAWSGVTTGDTVTMLGSSLMGLSYYGSSNGSYVPFYENWGKTFYITINSGTTNFNFQATIIAASATNMPSIGNAAIAIAPLGFADQWA